MSERSIAIPASASAGAAAGSDWPRLSFGRVIRGEWLKLTTVRSIRRLLYATVILLVAIWALVGLGFVLSTANREPAAVAARALINPNAIALLASISLAQLAAGVLGVIFVTSEYSTGIVRATFAAVPRRTPVLLAKATVLVVILWVTTVLALMAGFFACNAILGIEGMARHVWDPPLYRAIAGGAAYLAGIAVFGAAIGWVLRSAAGAMVTFVGIVIILPTLLPLVPLEAVRIAREYLPSVAGQNLFALPGLLQELTRDSLPPAWGIAVFVVYVVVASAIAAVLLKRADA